jgi:hypothetical protein
MAAVGAFGSRAGLAEIADLGAGTLFFVFWSLAKFMM